MCDATLKTVHFCNKDKMEIDDYKNKMFVQR